MGNKQGAAQIVLKERAENEGHQKGRFRDVMPAHIQAYQTHAEQRQDVEGVIVDGERPEQADAENGRKEDHFWRSGDFVGAAQAEKAGDQQKERTQDDAEVQRVDQGQIFLEKQGAGRDIVHHERAEHHGGDDVAGHAQREQGNQGGPAHAVIPGLGGGHAFQFALAEVGGPFGVAAGLAVGEIGGGRAAYAGNGPHDHTDKAAPADGGKAAFEIRPFQAALPHVCLNDGPRLR